MEEQKTKFIKAVKKVAKALNVTDQELVSELVKNTDTERTKRIISIMIEVWGK